MQNIGSLIRKLREKDGYPLRKVAAYLDIDQAILSKIERGKRKISKNHVIKLAKFFNYDEKEMLIIYLSDKILYEIGDEDYAKEALNVAEAKINYQRVFKIDRDKIENRISNIISKFSKINTAWIFGSFSRGDDKINSDIDIAIKTDKGFSYFDLAEVKHNIESELKMKIDIGFIDSFKPHVFKNLKNDLKLIYERK